MLRPHTPEATYSTEKSIWLCSDTPISLMAWHQMRREVSRFLRVAATPPLRWPISRADSRNSAREAGARIGWPRGECPPTGAGPSPVARRLPPTSPPAGSVGSHAGMETGAHMPWRIRRSVMARQRVGGAAYSGGARLAAEWRCRSAGV